MPSLFVHFCWRLIAESLRNLLFSTQNSLISLVCMNFLFFFFLVHSKKIFVKTFHARNWNFINWARRNPAVSQTNRKQFKLLKNKNFFWTLEFHLETFFLSSTEIFMCWRDENWQYTEEGMPFAVNEWKQSYCFSWWFRWKIVWVSIKIILARFTFVEDKMSSNKISSSKTRSLQGKENVFAFMF